MLGSKQFFCVITEYACTVWCVVSTMQAQLLPTSESGGWV